MTMDWWEDLWLNEGFASFFEFLGVNEAEKDWEMVSLKHMLSEYILLVETGLKPSMAVLGPGQV